MHWITYSIKLSATQVNQVNCLMRQTFTGLLAKILALKVLLEYQPTVTTEQWRGKKTNEDKQRLRRYARP